MEGPSSRETGVSRGRKTPRTDELRRQLIELGLEPVTASRLLREHLPRQVADTLDALERLGPQNVRDPARWALDVLRNGRDPAEILAGHRRSRAQARAWERQAAERDRVDDEYRQQAELAEAWREAVSGALDDEQLTVAVERVTTPLRVLNRRSVPVAAAQLTWWASTVHRDEPDRPLDMALAADLEDGPSTADPRDTFGEAPTPIRARGPLSDRIAEVLDRRPDLARVQPLRPDPPTDPGRSLEL